MRKNQVLKDFDELCLTMTTPSRTLDLKFITAGERAAWVNYLKAILIQRRESRR